jgi:Minichromosome loss protein, Mcl1, middle region
MAVATSSGLLRMFSSTGIPLALTALKGPIIAMVGYIHQLSGTSLLCLDRPPLILPACYIVAALHPLLFHHVCAPAVYYHDNGKTMVEVLEVSARDNVRKSTLVTSVPLSADSHLSWVGYSVTAGTCMDSMSHAM